MFQKLTRSGDVTDNNIDLSKLKLKVKPALVNYVLILDGNSMEIALKNNTTRHALAIMMICARSVIACNMLASQKQTLITFMKNCFTFDPRILAVGSLISDGAMLLEAHVGVGI
jgi:magnesium-transporting ATPase (P-type)